MRSSRFCFWLLLLLFILPHAKANSASGQKADKVVAATPTIGLSQLPVVVAVHKGFYRNENLEVLLVVMDGTVATRAAIAGDVDYVLAFASGVSARINGAPVKGVMGITAKGTATLVARPDIISGSDLKGKIIGVSGFGGSTHQQVLAALKHLRLDPKQDVSVINIGNSALRLAALKFKKIDATLLDAVYIRKAEELGFRRLLSMADVDEFPSTGIIVSLKKLREHSEQVRKMIRATLRAIAYLKQNRSEMIPFISKHLVVDPKDSEDLFELGVKVFSDSGRFSDAGLTTLIQQRDPKALERLTLADFADWSFLPAK